MWIGLSRNLVVQQIYITSEEAFDEFLMFVLFCFFVSIKFKVDVTLLVAKHV